MQNTSLLSCSSSIHAGIRCLISTIWRGTHSFRFKYLATAFVNHVIHKLNKVALLVCLLVFFGKSFDDVVYKISKLVTTFILFTTFVKCL